jgi:SAM-dependent methyltransferase
VTQQAPRLDEFVRLRLSPWVGREIKVLEAGCGARSPIAFGNSAHVVGLDIDSDAMRRNDELDETIVGDLESYPLPAEAFDIVFCRYVLEHLRNPERALANMRQALRAGGWLVVIFPNRWSLKGLVTRLTPHSLHKLGYRVLFGGGSFPCETRFASSVSDDGIRRFAECADLQVLTLEHHPGNFGWLLLKHSPLLGRLWLLLERFAQLLTLGRVSPHRREIIAVLADARPRPSSQSLR